MCLDYTAIAIIDVKHKNKYWILIEDQTTVSIWIGQADVDSLKQSY